MTTSPSDVLGAPWAVADAVMCFTMALLSVAGLQATRFVDNLGQRLALLAFCLYGVLHGFEVWDTQMTTVPMLLVSSGLVSFALGLAAKLHCRRTLEAQIQRERQVLQRLRAQRRALEAQT